MPYRKAVFGITNDVRISKNCEKCDRSLQYSIYNNIRLAFCIGRKSKYLCVECALKKSKHSKKSRCTVSDFDAYLNKLFGGTN